MMALLSSSGASANACKDESWDRSHLPADDYARCVQSRPGRHGQSLAARRCRLTAQQVRWTALTHSACGKHCRKQRIHAMASCLGTDRIPGATTQEPSTGVLLRLLQLLPLLDLGEQPAAGKSHAWNWIAAGSRGHSSRCASIRQHRSERQRRTRASWPGRAAKRAVRTGSGPGSACCAARQRRTCSAVGWQRWTPEVHSTLPESLQALL